MKSFSRLSFTPTIKPLFSLPTSKLTGRRSFIPLALQRSDHDVVVVGAGIIGLTIARELLLRSDLSVAVVDAGVPCSGATGAGQGYIWLGHKTPGSDTWELARRSKQLWEEMAESVEREGLDPLEEMGWKKTGSLLIGRTLEDLVKLEEKVKLISQTGMRAEYLSTASLVSKEPALEVGREGGAAFFPDDCQLDASRTVAYIEKANKHFTSQGRYADFYNNPVIGLVRSQNNGAVEAVQTSHNILYGKKAVVIAAGAWAGPLMRSIVAKPDAPDVPVKPRKGHLLVLENFDEVQLNHGLMEVGYIDYQVVGSPNMSPTSGADDNEQDLSSVSMTATMDTMGNLVLGSSRQFSGFNKDIDKHIIRRIWDRATEFFPALRDLSLDSVQNRTIRIGHRPYMPDGKPIIGHVPALPNLLLATGHEGNGLCMALGTAEMVADMIEGNSTKVAMTRWTRMLGLMIWLHSSSEVLLRLQIFRCHEKAVEDALCKRIIVIRDENITKNLDPRATTLNRDALAKIVYSQLFDWLVNKINNTIGQDPNSEYLIGVLDIYGFESFKTNRC